MFPDTPGPDQFPLMPFRIVGNDTGGLFSQIDVGTPTINGVITGVTAMFAVLEIAHCPASGMNVNVIFPLKPFGLNVFEVTPGPDQLPVYPFTIGGSAIGKSVSQRDEGTPVISGVTSSVTSMLCVAGDAH